MNTHRTGVASFVLVCVVFMVSGCGGEQAAAHCEPGNMNCSCLSGNEPCRAVDLLCLGGKCVECELGTQGCGCTDGNTCVTPGLICENGRCHSRAIRPDNPICYTPCRQDLEKSDGSASICSAEGLMEGCIGGRECTNGSCILPGEEPAACSNDSGCPDFQTCIEGSCYSTCLYDSECDDGWSCYRHVCRRRCSTLDNPCTGSDRVCVAYDGINGYCMPATTAPDSQQREVRGSYDAHPLS